LYKEKITKAGNYLILRKPPRLAHNK